jgi:acyl-CoA reductase-like NAD-dependent aldehyde dehydrogenase
MSNNLSYRSFQPVEEIKAPQSSLKDAMDEALGVLQAQKDVWAACSIGERVAILDRLVKDYYAVVPRIIETELQCKGAAGSDFAYTTEFMSVYSVVRNLNNLKRSLRDIEAYGTPRIPGEVHVRPNGQTAAQVFPEDRMQRAMFAGYSAEVWMEPGVTPESLPGTQAAAYQEKDRPGEVALVLGAGNVNSIPLADALYKLFVEKRVVLVKMNPVNAAVGPLFAEGFRALVEQGFLRIVYGGAAEGSYLCQHPSVDEIHITGSDKSFEAIVFGPGPDGALRKAARAPRTQKTVTGELGCITPVVIVPGPWTPAEIDYQADRLVSWLGVNAGFACNTPHLIVTHAAWPLRPAFLDALRKKMASMALPKAYYPGAKTVHQRFVDRHPEAELFGKPPDGAARIEETLPWTLIPSVSSENPDDICFTTEGFCSLLAETPIAAASVPEFLERSVDFLNNQVWGTLSAALFVHPASLKNPADAAAVERALEGLHYGAVCVNQVTPFSYIQPVCPWGGFPGQPLEDIQSGTGWVHNTLMFEKPQKVVLRAPFVESPKSPFLFHRAKLSHALARQLVDLEAAPSLWKFLGILYAVMRG